MSQLGINKSKVRLAKSGDVLIEVYGEDNRLKASKLAGKLTGLMEGIKIGRPEKQGYLRIYGFDESVDKQDIIRSLCSEDTCQPDDLKIGSIIKSRNGLYTTTIRCELGIAIKLSKLRKVRLGWSIVSLELLKYRPQHCYRCLETGHISVNCKNTVDRKGLCFRYSSHGHIAFMCNAEYYCIVCADKKLPCDHSIGSIRCGTSDEVGEQQSNFNYNTRNVPHRSNVGTIYSDDRYIAN